MLYRPRPRVFLLLLLGMSLFLSGCGSPKLVTASEYIAFTQAGPMVPQVDRAALARARTPDDIYRVVTGDVIEIEMPLVLVSQEPAALDAMAVYKYRVDGMGSIHMPVIGVLNIKGLDLAEIENKVMDAFHPRYVVDRPAVIARVADYQTQVVTIAGAVATPGQYRLRSDEMSLVALLMKAGGVDQQAGAAVIRIDRPGTDRPEQTEPIILPVSGLNIPFADIPLQKGDRVEVERLKPEVFTVVGLVKRPGAFPYPPETGYNVMQALAFAGGVNEIADPKYIRVYRLTAAGDIVDATFKINGSGITDATRVMIKPGDVVSVEQTGRETTRLFFAEAFQIQTGATVYYRWGETY